MKKRKIVLKIDPETDPREVYCTTYQMRNFYAQLKDGFFSSLDVMNYIQHHAAVLRMKSNWRVLDLCCGRGLLLPLIRYYRKGIKEYVGVDISATNMAEQTRRSGCKSIDDFSSYYPFKVTQVLSSVEDIDGELKESSFHFIIYTSSIEHMQKKAGIKSLKNCFKLLKPGHSLFLSCPNTINKKDPYDTQYAAHVYEWDADELKKTLLSIGFEIKEEYGLVAKVRDFEKWLELPGHEMVSDQYNRLKKYLPSQWLMSFMPILYPEISSEILLIAKKPRY